MQRSGVPLWKPRALTIRVLCAVSDFLTMSFENVSGDAISRVLAPRGDKLHIPRQLPVGVLSIHWAPVQLPIDRPLNISAHCIKLVNFEVIKTLWFWSNMGSRQEYCISFRRSLF